MSIIQKLVGAYKIWQQLVPHFPKNSKYTLGAKIDSLFLEVIEQTIRASISDKVEKMIALKKASVALDLVKFFLQIAWELKNLENKEYIRISEKLAEIGRMLGGWIKSLK